jgi:aubergine-like protein
MLVAASVNNWVVFVPKAMYRETGAFIELVQRAAKGMNMLMDDPTVIQLDDDRLTTYINTLGEFLSTQRPQLVVCCVSNNKADRYSAIKKICCVDRPGEYN